jgi:hypothetical protein
MAIERNGIMNTDNSRTWRWLLGVLVASTAVLYSLASAAGDEGIAAKPDPMQFARGAKTWANNCSHCHNMRNPKDLRDDQWRAVVTHMRVRAGMTGDEARDVLTFLEGSN